MRRGCGGPPHKGLPAAGFKFRRRAVAGGSGVCVSCVGRRMPHGPVQ